MTSPITGRPLESPLDDETRLVRALPKLLPIAAVLVALGGWYQQAKQTEQAVAEIRYDIRQDYQRKDVAAEQYQRLYDKLSMIEYRLQQQSQQDAVDAARRGR